MVIIHPGRVFFSAAPPSLSPRLDPQADPLKYVPAYGGFCSYGELRTSELETRDGVFVATAVRRKTLCVFSTFFMVVDRMLW